MCTRLLWSNGSRLAVVVAVLCWAPAARAWVSVFDEPIEARTLSIDANGDVIVSGSERSPLQTAGQTVKLDGRTGAELWREPLEAVVSALDPAGDVMVGGRSRPGGACMRVAKLRSTDGAVLWIYTEPGCVFQQEAQAIAVGPTGDVVAASPALNARAEQTVVKLDGATGALLWRAITPELFLSQIAIDAGGDVLLSVSNGQLGVIKLDGATGAQVWLRTYDGPAGPALVGGARHVLALPGGDALVLGGIDGSATVVRFDPTGAVVWQAFVGPGEAIAAALDGNDRVVVGGVESPSLVALDLATGAVEWAVDAGTPGAIAVDAAGDVLTFGWLVEGRNTYGAIAMKRSGVDGTEIWRRTFSGIARHRRRNFGQQVALDASGSVVVAGEFKNNDDFGGQDDLGVAKLRNSDGSSLFDAPCGSVQCAPCEVCQAPDVCVAAPRDDCYAPLEVTARSQLDLRDGATPAADSVAWKWGGGSGVAAADLGDPRLATDLTLCIYEDAVAAPHLLREQHVGAMADCGRVPCWRLGGKPDAPAFAYTEKISRPEGKGRLTVKLRSGAERRGSLRLKGKGPTLGIPPLGLTLPVRAELRASTGACWASTFDAPVDANDPARFKARGGP
jgi:outer membrane protein assembly factor BamB